MTERFFRRGSAKLVFEGPQSEVDAAGTAAAIAMAEAAAHTALEAL